MKAQKCPHCGCLDEIYMGCCCIDCPECGESMLCAEEVELIDWEYELITNNKPPTSQ